MDARTARSLLRYDPETGELFWRIRASQRVKPGDRAGANGGDGYLTVGIRGKNWAAHRLAWLIHHGQLPSGMIDHINGDRSDNRAVNLRDVTPKENAQNLRSAHRDSKSGFLGVSPYRKKWAAQIMRAGKLRRLGNFPTPEEAAQAYLQAKAEFDASETPG